MVMAGDRDSMLEFGSWLETRFIFVKTLFIKVKTLPGPPPPPPPPKMAHSNMPPHVYFTMWKYLHNAAQMFTKKRRHGFSNRSSAEAAMSGRHFVFLCESKSTLFGLPKVDAFRNHYYLQQNSYTFYGRPFCEPRRGGNSDFAMTIWRF